MDEGVIEFDAIRAFDMEEAYDVAEGIGDGGYTHVVDVLEWDADPLSYAVELLEDERGHIDLKDAEREYLREGDRVNALLAKWSTRLDPDDFQELSDDVAAALL